MSSEHPELDELQTTYKAAVESWISAIRNEEALVSANHSMAEIDRWEQAAKCGKGRKGAIRGRVAR
jgi:hypothetical protein